MFQCEISYKIVLSNPQKQWALEQSQGVLSSACLHFLLKINGEININNETIINPRLIGRVRKIKKLPLDIINDCRKVFSNNGPRIKARIKGAPS